MRRHQPSPLTRSVRRGIASDSQHGAVVPPVYLSSMFAYETLDRKRTHDYTRDSNPTREDLEHALADLEGGKGAVVTSSGTSALLLALQLVEPGGLVVAPFDCYGGTRRLLVSLAKRGHFEVDFRDLTTAQPLSDLPRAPAVVWLETPSNPLLRITDIRKVAAEAHALGALVIADNTVLSPALQQPLSLGADVVVHSTTKYLNGHSDVVGGCVVAADDDVLQTLRFWARCLGITGAPFDSYLTLRGLRTLFPRMAGHVRNAQAVAVALSSHEAVERVYYPGLPSHPGHDIAALQQSAFGALLSFELHGGAESVRCFIEHLQYFTLAKSLGGVESLIAHPATMSHAHMAPDERVATGITDNLVRLSIGIESVVDLVHDLRQALDQVLQNPQATTRGSVYTEVG